MSSGAEKVGKRILSGDTDLCLSERGSQAILEASVVHVRQSGLARSSYSVPNFGAYRQSSRLACSSLSGRDLAGLANRALYVNNLAHGTTAMIEGSGHYSQTEMPDAVAALIVPFLISRRKKRGPRPCRDFVIIEEASLQQVPRRNVANMVKLKIIECNTPRVFRRIAESDRDERDNGEIEYIVMGTARNLLPKSVSVRLPAAASKSRCQGPGHG